MAVFRQCAEMEGVIPEFLQGAEVESVVIPEFRQRAEMEGVVIPEFLQSADVEGEKIRIFFVGDPGVGKSTFIANYCRHLFKHAVTNKELFCKYKFDRISNGQNVSVELTDVGENSQIKDLLNTWKENIESVIYRFDMNSLDNLKNIYRVWTKEFRVKHPGARSFLLGLKNNPEREAPNLNKFLVLADNLQDFSGQFTSCSSMEQPEDAIKCMETLINEVLMYRACLF